MAREYDAGRWKTSQASDHAGLLNKFMGLCTNTHRWPRMLHKIGFRVQLVERRISAWSGSITPDVVGASDLLSHALVAGCKGGKSVDKP